MKLKHSSSRRKTHILKYVLYLSPLLKSKYQYNEVKYKFCICPLSYIRYKLSLCVCYLAGLCKNLLDGFRLNLVGAEEEPATFWCGSRKFNLRGLLVLSGMIRSIECHSMCCTWHYWILNTSVTVSCYCCSWSKKHNNETVSNRPAFLPSLLVFF